MTLLLSPGFQEISGSGLSISAVLRRTLVVWKIEINRNNSTFVLGGHFWKDSIQICLGADCFGRNPSPNVRGADISGKGTTFLGVGSGLAHSSTYSAAVQGPELEP